MSKFDCTEKPTEAKEGEQATSISQQSTQSFQFVCFFFPSRLDSLFFIRKALVCQMELREKTN